jgi:hypothetical protein
VEGFSGGYIKGTIKYPQAVPAFLSIIFIYFFYMFWIYLQREKSTYNVRVNNLISFGIEITRYIIKREIGKFFPRSLSEEYEPKNFSVIGSENLVRTQFILDPEIRQSHEKEIQGLSGFSLDQHVVMFEYEISQADKKFYEENKDLFKTIIDHEFMKYKFPKYFGLSVLLVIIGFNWYKAIIPLFRM